MDYSFSRLDGMRQATGNPLQIEIKQFGKAVAFAIQAWPDFWYGNKVLGIAPSSEAYLDEIIDFFASCNLGFRFEIMPGELNSALASRLHQLGFCQMSFNTAMYGLPSLDQGSWPNQQVKVRQVYPDETNRFLDLYQEGFELPPLNGQEREVVLSWLERAKQSVSLCMAFVNNTVVGVGILYIKDGIGLLADAATLPDYRRQGCHAAMLQHRIAYAAENHCELLTSFVEFGSASHRNLERAGLRVAYTKAMWWKAA